MIEFLSSWVKGLGLAIIIVSILEMLLPNNKTKKYIRMVMGVYILFTIISPFVQNKEILSSSMDLEKYMEESKSNNISMQNGMEDRVKQLYIQELEKDITKKLKEKGYEATKCVVDVKIDKEAEETKIAKIKLNVKKSEQGTNKNISEETIENTIVVRN